MGLRIQQINGVNKLNAVDRYHHFIGRIADWEIFWLLSNGHNPGHHNQSISEECIFLWYDE